MAEEVLLLSSPSESCTSLLSEISNASTRAFVLAFTVGSCGAFAFGCIIGYSAPTQSSIMKDLNLSIADASSILSILYSLFGSILTVGLILGALICGKLTDLVGRVYTIWITNILFVIGWFAIAFAKAVWLLDLGRLLQGISIGISAYLGPVYITEIAPRKLRGAACSMSQLFTGVGISVVYALGTVVAWRNLAILGSIPSLMILPLLFFIPESPRWLAKVGREKEVEEILSRLRGENSDVSDEAGEILIGVVLIALPQLGGLSGYSFYTESIFISTGVLGTVLVDVSGRRSLLLENHCWETGTPILGNRKQEHHDLSSRCEGGRGNNVWLGQLYKLMARCLFLQFLVSVEYHRNISDVYHSDWHWICVHS
ncbi:hypothetical protein YC2023_029307 [Brassica napus]